MPARAERASVAYSAEARPPLLQRLSMVHVGSLRQHCTIPVHNLRLQSITRRISQISIITAMLHTQLIRLFLNQMHP